MIKNKKSFVVALLLVSFITFLKCKDYTWRNQENPYPIGWDFFGYYLYLPATFVYHDLGLEDRSWQEKIHTKYKPSSTPYQTTQGKDNRQLIIYNIGLAIIYSPGFFVADALASSSGYERDGFSKPYQLSLQITAFLITVLGIFFFRKIILLFFTDAMSAILLCVVLLGTNYYFQVTYDAVMPHNFLFTLNCFILWYTIRWHETKKIKHAILLALFLGLATICRPTDLIWILIPALWGISDKNSFLEKWAYIKSHVSTVWIFLLVLILVLFIQLAYVKYASGSFFEINAHGERFSFFDPYTFKFLFSYKKGWLLYTPIMVFGVIGFYFLRKKNNYIWLSLFSFFVINLYVVSSWECWWYGGGSFSMRPMVETYVMMVFPMGYFLSWVAKESKSWIKISLSILLPFLILLNIFQTWQFLNGILHMDRNTQAYYWSVFGKTAVDEETRKLLAADRSLTTFADYDNYIDKYDKKEVFRLTFEEQADPKMEKYIVDTTAKEGKHSAVLKDEIAYSKQFENTISEMTEKSYLWVRASAWVYLTTPYTESNSCIVLLTESRGRLTQYVTSNYQSVDIPLFKWTPVHVDLMTYEPRHSDDKLKSYFWNMGNKPVLIDDFKVEIFEPIVDPR